MGCAASKTTEINPDTAPSAGDKETSEQQEEVVTSDEPEAPAEESESIVKKHPPKRLQRLEEQPQTILTSKDLDGNDILPQGQKDEEQKEIPETVAVETLPSSQE
ncbi:uncharacterized protein LOC143254358 [Tachypleus tridentatus]|uniref:uncharacterized protein LOC143254358 n=1 Tax=Tachypleus tridentatus TaxID=6853 RepID=UPI003FD3555B